MLLITSLNRTCPETFRHHYSGAWSKNLLIWPFGADHFTVGPCKRCLIYEHRLACNNVSVRNRLPTPPLHKSYGQPITWCTLFHGSMKANKWPWHLISNNTFDSFSTTINVLTSLSAIIIIMYFVKSKIFSNKIIANSWNNPSFSVLFIFLGKNKEWVIMNDWINKWVNGWRNEEMVGINYE